MPKRRRNNHSPATFEADATKDAIGVGARVLRVQANRFSKCVVCLINAAQLGQNDTEIVLRLRKSWTQSQRLAEQFDADAGIAEVLRDVGGG